MGRREGERPASEYSAARTWRVDTARLLFFAVLHLDVLLGVQMH